MPRNVLLIVADDLGKNLSCYGDPNVSTPHIDSLSARGTRFDRAFASTASCSGSRSTIYTGLHTHTNGQYGLNHKHHHFMTHDHIESLPKVFNDAGYLTGIIGKVHVGPDAVYPWTVKHEGWAGDRNVQAMSEAAGTFMDRARTEDKSWNLIVAFHDPHRDGTRDGFANRGDHPGVTDTLFDPAKIQVPDYLTDLPEVRAELAEYYRSISRFDQGVGMVLKKLQDSNQVDDTMVILVSDNGPPFVNSKTTMFDAGICLPLIAAVPGQSGGKTSLAMISFLDILPTCLDYCGITPPPNTTSPPRLGRSFVSLLDESGSPADWSAVYGSHTFHGIAEFYPTRYLRTPRYKYHRNVCWKLDFPFASDLFSSKAWAATRNSTKETKGEVMMGPRGLKQYIRRRPEELYDLESDPHEIHDLSRDEKHRDVLLDMREKMKVWQKESLDPWLWQDGASLLGLERYMEQDPTFTLPDRFDFDPEHPST